MSLDNWGEVGGRSHITIEYAKKTLEVKACGKELSSSCRDYL